MNLKNYIRSIPDYPKKGILFRDITTLIKDENAFAETINQIVQRSKKFSFNKIAAIESRGFVFASAVSYILKKPFIMLRKKNKLPAEVHSMDFELEYGKATIEVHKDSIDQNDSVLIAEGKLEGLRVTVGAQNFNFIGGAVGAASGEAFIHGVQNAITNQTPFIFFSCSLVVLYSSPIVQLILLFVVCELLITAFSAN